MACPFRIIVGLFVVLLASVLFFIHFLWDKESTVSTRTRLWLLMDNWLVYVPMPQSFREYILLKLCPDTDILTKDKAIDLAAVHEVLTASSPPSSPDSSPHAELSATQLTSIHPNVSQCPFFSSRSSLPPGVTAGSCPFLSALRLNSNTSSTTEDNTSKLDKVRRLHADTTTRTLWKERSVSYKVAYVSLIAVIVWLHIELFCRGCMMKTVMASVSNAYYLKFDSTCLSCNTASTSDLSNIDSWLFEQ